MCILELCAKKIFTEIPFKLSEEFKKKRYYNLFEIFIFAIDQSSLDYFGFIKFVLNILVVIISILNTT
jgi:hypothetical protein